MLSQDRLALNRTMRLTFEGELPAVDYYLADANYELDESKTSAVFAFNPDVSEPVTISSANIWRQLGIATLQILQPKDIDIAEGEPDAWEIADIATAAFKQWRSDDKLTEVYKFAVNRIQNDRYIQLNVLLYWRSKRP